MRRRATSTSAGTHAQVCRAADNKLLMRRFLIPLALTLLAALMVPSSGWASPLPGLLTNQNVRHPFQVRPAVVGYTGDGTGFLGGFGGGGKHHWGHMTWLTWTAYEATGTGALWGDDCEPDCAQGTFSPVSVKVRAFAPHGGHFTRLKLMYDRDGNAVLDERGTQHYRSQYAPGGGYWEYFIVRHTEKPVSKTVSPGPTTEEPSNKPETGPFDSTLTVHDANGNALAVYTGIFGKEGEYAPEYEEPKTGEHFVAIYLSLTNRSSSTISGDADGSTTVIGSNHNAYQTNFESLAGSCTNFSSGVFSLLSGETENGCVLFELPGGVTVQTIQFGLGLPPEALWNG